jgi:molybdopterin-binding protein
MVAHARSTKVLTHGLLSDAFADRVGVTLPDGQRINAVVTSGAVDDLDVTVGDDVLVVVKSTEVMLARPSA